MLKSVEDCSHLIVSCGGGMPPGVPTENIQALISAVERL
jgi:uroporphyrinogen-III decarboxylase